MNVFEPAVEPLKTSFAFLGIPIEIKDSQGYVLQIKQLTDSIFIIQRLCHHHEMH
jgi:hypothetical protein